MSVRLSWVEKYRMSPTRDGKIPKTQKLWIAFFILFYKMKFFGGFKIKYRFICFRNCWHCLIGIRCEISTNTRNGLRCIRNRTKSTQLFYFLNSSLCNWDKLTFPPMLLHSDSHPDRSKARVAFDLLITWMDLLLEWCSLRSYQSRRAAHSSDSHHVMNLQMREKERLRLGEIKISTI